ncbi:MAG: branched-chain amino acid ABC transporter permease [Acidimicrobiales bacterium]
MTAATQTLDPGAAAPSLDIPRRFKLLAAVGLAAVLVGVPTLGSVVFVLRATQVLVFCVAFTGLHILSGRLGLISVGHGAFIGIGALVAAHAIDDVGVPYLLAPLAGAVGGAALGALLGVPSLRLPGAYLALLTLAMAMALPIAMRQVDGPLGYRVDGDIRPPAWTGLTEAETSLWQFALVLVVGAALVGLLHLVIRGRFTREMIAARDEPAAAAAFGVNVHRVRLTGVVLSAAMAGAAGGLLLYASPLVSASHYPFQLSVSMFALMLALGASRMWTAVPAAVILVLLPDLLTWLDRAAYESIIYAIVLLTMTRVSRGRGLVSLLDRYRTSPVAPGMAQTASTDLGAGTATPQTASNEIW